MESEGKKEKKNIEDAMYVRKTHPFDAFWGAQAHHSQLCGEWPPPPPDVFFFFFWQNACLWLRSCLFCEGRISVLKRWFKTPIQNALHGSTVHASLEKKTISWACTAHCSRLLFELKWTGKAFIWRHLNVVICDFAFMLPPESAFCSNHDRKRTFLGVLNQRFETTFIRK